jgi:hypothetical protein
MSLCKLQQHRNCKHKLQRNQYKLHLQYLGYDLYGRITATSTFMLPLPISTISYSNIFQEYQRRIITHSSPLGASLEASEVQELRNSTQVIATHTSQKLEQPKKVFIANHHNHITRSKQITHLFPPPLGRSRKEQKIRSGQLATATHTWYHHQVITNHTIPVHGADHEG